MEAMQTTAIELGINKSRRGRGREGRGGEEKGRDLGIRFSFTPFIYAQFLKYFPATPLHEGRRSKR